MKGQKKKKAGLSSYLRERFSIWCDVLRKPSETFAKEKKNASLMQGAKDIVTLPLIFTIVGFVLAMIVAIALGEVERSAMIIPIGFAILALGSCIALLIGWLVFSGIGYGVAKLLGGKGNFKEHAYACALWQAIALPITIVLLALPTIYLTAIGAFDYFCNEWDNILVVAFAIQAMAIIYPLYLNFKVVRAVHMLSSFRSLIVSIISPGIMVILAILMLGATFNAMLYYSNFGWTPDEKAYRYGMLATCHVFSRDYKSSVAYLDKAIELQPNEPRYFNDRAFDKFVLGNMEGAIADSTKAIELTPNDAYQYYFRAYYKYKAGDLSGSRMDAELAHSMNSTVPDYAALVEIIQNESKRS